MIIVVSERVDRCIYICVCIALCDVADDRLKQHKRQKLKKRQKKSTHQINSKERKIFKPNIDICLIVCMFQFVFLFHPFASPVHLTLSRTLALWISIFSSVDGHFFMFFSYIAHSKIFLFTLCGTKSSDVISMYH